MPVQDMFDDGQSKAGATALPAPFDVRAIETFGESRNAFAGYALAFILDCDKYLTRRASVGGGVRLPKTDLHPAALAPIFDGVVDQILKHLAEFIAFANNPQRLVFRDVDFHSVGIGQNLQRARRIAHDAD